MCCYTRHRFERVITALYSRRAQDFGFSRTGGYWRTLVPLKFVDLFAGLGGFHLALKSFGFECVFVSEINDELRELYVHNFPDALHKTYGDIRKYKDKVPSHDILCAGFPCQPFSKSGAQLGPKDATRGTLFREIIEILETHNPTYVILENVGNFERHDGGNTWRVVRESLVNLGYDVKGTEHIEGGGTGLISPHHFGHPHARERFFVVAKKEKLPDNPLPQPDRHTSTNLTSIIQGTLTKEETKETSLSTQQTACIELWNEFLSLIPPDVTLPSFPLWTDEFGATYRYQGWTPFASNTRTLRCHLHGKGDDPNLTKEQLVALYPSYARSKTKKFPKWKERFIEKNRTWYEENREYITEEWITRLRNFPSSLRKLEWNIKEPTERNVWNYVLQFRPSGLRVRRFNSVPALVAMTDTQIPILGPQRRFLTRKEGLRLQGFPETHHLPKSYVASFRALGNAVHVAVVKEIMKTLTEVEEVEKESSTTVVHALSVSSEVENTHNFFCESGKHAAD
jgi:DNA (cytosine-5)-methyltransferase 1